MNSDADKLFRLLDAELLENVESQYFQETREFRSLIQVLEVLNEGMVRMNRGQNQAGKDLQSALKEQNSGQQRLHNQLDTVNKVIEEVVTFQHGGLNYSVDTMSDVVKEYSRGRTEIQNLRKALVETQSVLTAKKSGQIPLKELWLKKVELQESLRMVKELEELKNTPLKVQRLMSAKKYYSAVRNISRAVAVMFGEDLVGVQGLVIVREKIMDLKEVLLEACVNELKEVVIGTLPSFNLKFDEEGGEESDNENVPDNSSVVSFKHLPSGNSIYITSEQNVFSFYQLGGGMGVMGVGVGGTGAGLPPTSSPWSLDLGDVDEQLENSLLDPSTSPALFIRLLVKTIGEMGCEEDVERMLLDSLSTSFLEHIFFPYKDRVQNKLNVGDLDESVYERGFGEYVGGLLEALLGGVQRLLYVCRLLSLSKLSHKEKNRVETEGKTILSALANSNNSTSLPPLTAREGSREKIKEVWSELEEKVIMEMRVHFVEKEIESISDKPQGGFGKSSKGSRKSIGGAGRGETGTGAGEEEEEEKRWHESRVIFPPSSRYAATVYKKVHIYSLRYQRICKEHYLEDEEVQSFLSSPPTATLSPSAAMQLKGETVLQAMQRLGGQAAAGAVPGGVAAGPTAPPSRLLLVLQSFLEAELIPVIQSNVNLTLRDLQLSPNLYSSPSSLSEHNTVEQRGAWRGVPPALELSLPPIESLFRYWAQLFQHREMVCVVLGRLIGGVAMAARGARESLSFSAPSLTLNLNPDKEAMKIMRGDKLYEYYRGRVQGGKGSLEEALSLSPLTNKEGEKSLVGIEERELGRFYEKEIATVYGAAYWELSNNNFTVKGVKAANVLGGLACVSYVVDLLAKKVISMSNQTTRKASSSLSPAAQQTPTSASTKGTQFAGSSDRQTLSLSVLEGLKDLQRSSDEVLSLLRIELCLVSFMHFHKLTMLALSTLSSALSSSSHATPSTARSLPEEELLSTFFQQLTTLLVAIEGGLSPHALPLLLGPLCSLLPRLLSRMATIIYYAAPHGGSVLQNRLLRIVIFTQQQFSSLLSPQSSALSSMQMGGEMGGMRRVLGDLLYQGCEDVRRLLQAVGLTAQDLQVFLEKHGEHYSKEEVKFLKKMTASDQK